MCLHMFKKMCNTSTVYFLMFHRSAPLVKMWVRQIFNYGFSLADLGLCTFSYAHFPKNFSKSYQLYQQGCSQYFLFECPQNLKLSLPWSHQRLNDFNLLKVVLADFLILFCCLSLITAFMFVSSAFFGFGSANLIIFS